MAVSNKAYEWLGNLTKYDNESIADNIIVTNNLKIPIKSSNDDSTIYINNKELKVNNDIGDLYIDNDTKNIVFRKQNNDIAGITNENVLTNLYVSVNTKSWYDNNIYVKGTISINGELYVDNVIYEKKTTVFNQELLTIDQVSVKENVYVVKNLSVNNFSYQKDNVFMNNRLSVKSTTNIEDSLSIKNSIIVNDNVYIADNLTINDFDPKVTVNFNVTDAMKIPKGTTAQRPIANANSHKGYLRYNTEYDIFEAFGTNNTWYELGPPIRDSDKDTYINAENTLGEDNDQLKMVTANNLRMIIESNGNIGVGKSAPKSLLHMANNGNTSLLIENSNGTFANQDQSIEFKTNYATTAFIHQKSEDLRIGSGGGAAKIKFYTSSWAGFAPPNNYSNSLIEQTYNANNDTANMIIDNDGNVGIGNHDPDTALHIFKNDNTVQNYIKLTRSNNIDFGSLGYSDDLFYINSLGNIPLVFGSNGTEKMRLSSDGNLGINKTNPTKKLDVNGNGIINGIFNSTTSLAVGTSNTPRRTLDIEGNSMFTGEGLFKNNLFVEGSLGVGATSAVAKVDIVGANNDPSVDTISTTVSKGLVRLKSTGAASYMDIGLASNDPWGAWIQTHNGNVNDNNSEVLLLQPVRGNVGIGQTKPNSLLHITKSGKASLIIENSNGLNINQDQSIEFKTNSGTVGFIHQKAENLRIASTGTCGTIKWYTNNWAGMTTPNDYKNALIEHTYTEENDNPTMILGSSGHLGLGKASQNARFHIFRHDNTAQDYIKLTRNTNIDFGSIGYTNDYLYINSLGNIPFIFGTNATERMRLSADGKLSIKHTTNIEDNLSIKNSITVSDNVYIADNLTVNDFNPKVTVNFNTTDSMKIPKGTLAQRPTANADTHKGYLRFNTEYDYFEGYGTDNAYNKVWYELGPPVRDLDRDTYINAENSVGSDNDQLKFVTTNNIRMIIEPDGNVGIGQSAPKSLVHLAKSGSSSLVIENSNGTYTNQDQSIEFKTNYATTGFIHQKSEDLRIGSTGTSANIKFYTNSLAGFGPTANFSNALIEQTYNVDNDKPNMIIDNNGNVGIGNHDPNVSLQIFKNLATETDYIRLTRSTNIDFASLGYRNNLFYINSLGDIPLIFGTNATEKMRLSADGNLGINKINPTKKLDMVGDGLITGLLNISNSLAIGISNTAAVAKLDIVGADKDPSTDTISSIVSEGLLRLKSTGPGTYMDIGLASNNPWGGWIQTHNGNLNDTNSEVLLLQPVRGNVGIGIKNPSALLDVNGSVHSSSTLDVAGIVTFDSLINANAGIAVAGIVTFDSLINANAGIAVDTDKFTVADGSGNIHTAGTLDVVNITTLDSIINANGGIAVDTDKFTVADVSGNIHTAGTLDVAGVSTFDNLINANKGIAVDTDKFTVEDATGNTHTAGTLDVVGISTFDNLINANKGIAVDTDKFTVEDATGNTHTAGTLDVVGVSTFDNLINANKGIAVDTDKFTVEDGTGNTIIAGTLNVLGFATYEAGINLKEGITVNTDKFTVDKDTGNTHTAGNITSTGKLGIGTVTPNVPLEIKTGTGGQTDTFLQLTGNYNGFPINSGINLDFGSNNYGVGKTNTSPLWRIGLTETTEEGVKFNINSPYTSDNQLLTIVRNGNIGINKTTPETYLHIEDKSSVNTFMQIIGKAGDVAGIKIGRGDADHSDTLNNLFGVLVTDTGLSFAKLTNTGNNITGRDDYMFISNDGNVGIGVTSPTTSKLDVDGTIKCTGLSGINTLSLTGAMSAQSIEATGTGSGVSKTWQGYWGSGTSTLSTVTGNTGKGSWGSYSYSSPEDANHIHSYSINIPSMSRTISQTNAVDIYGTKIGCQYMYTTSDIRLKRYISKKNSKNALNQILKLNLKKFIYINKQTDFAGKFEYGFIAQEVINDVANCISTDKYKTINIDNETVQFSIENNNLTIISEFLDTNLLENTLNQFTEQEYKPILKLLVQTTELKKFEYTLYPEHTYSIYTNKYEERDMIKIKINDLLDENYIEAFGSTLKAEIRNNNSIETFELVVHHMYLNDDNGDSFLYCYEPLTIDVDVNNDELYLEIYTKCIEINKNIKSITEITQGINDGKYQIEFNESLNIINSDNKQYYISNLDEYKDIKLENITKIVTKEIVIQNVLSVDYRQIFCLNVCATQENNKLILENKNSVEELDNKNNERIKSLEDENTTLKTRVSTLETTVEELKSNYVALLAKIEELQK
jgi:hypothetical protein